MVINPYVKKVKKRSIPMPARPRKSARVVDEPINMAQRRRAIAQETINITNTRGYVLPDGGCVRIGPNMSFCIGNTMWHPAKDTAVGNFFEKHLPGMRGAHTTSIHVVEQDTLEAAGALSLILGLDMPPTEPGGGPIAVLNFACPVKPGGGFLAGEQAQEECIARASGLYEALKSRGAAPFYDLNKTLMKDGTYTHAIVYSPRVPVFRAAGGGLLPQEKVFATSVITCSAVSVPEVMKVQDKTGQPLGQPLLREVSEVMKTRIRKVLTVAALHGDEHLILGAWGCGGCRQEPTNVARLFKSELDGPFAGVFKTVLFAIVPEKRGRSSVPGKEDTKARAFRDVFSCSKEEGNSTDDSARTQ